MTGDAAPLRISRTHFPVTALGPGVRLGIWLQGCPLACPGCMSLDTWEGEAGVDVSDEVLLQQWCDAMDAGADGITISGGEPLAQAGPLHRILGKIDDTRREATGRTGAEHDILLFTGYELAELSPAQAAAAHLADVVVTGRYRAAEPTELIWRGSANQEMHLQSDLARRRYTDYLGFTPERPPLQIEADPGGFRIIGVPRRGMLQALDRTLRLGELAVERVTWRPERGR